MDEQNNDHIFIIIGTAIGLFCIGILFILSNTQAIIADKTYSAGLLLILISIVLGGFGLAILDIRRTKRNALIVIFFGLSLFLGYLFWSSNRGFELPEKLLTEELKYELFQDLLILIIAGSTIIISLLGYAAYRILESNTEKNVNKMANSTLNKALSGTMGRMGYSCWKKFETTKKAVDLEQAIYLTNIAYQEFAVLLDESDKGREELICKLKNNLAYYLAEYWVLGKANSEQKTLALAYAENINMLKEQFAPNVTKGFIDTYNFVQGVASRETTSQEPEKQKPPKKKKTTKKKK